MWEGRSLAGQMLGELSSALDYLAARPDVDADRIGVFGISMGATFGYWLAAVEPRIACVMHLCCFADFRELIATGAHDLHGIYLTIPGLLDIAGNGEIAGLIAPRPQLICIGDQDPLTPPRAVDLAFAANGAAYEAAGARDRLVLHREAETGHEESAAMREHMLAFAGMHLKGNSVRTKPLVSSRPPPASNRCARLLSISRLTFSPHADPVLAFQHDEQLLAVTRIRMDDRLRAERLDEASPWPGFLRPLARQAGCAAAGCRASPRRPASRRFRRRRTQARARPARGSISPPPSPAAALEARKFMCGAPMKPATKRLAGLL